MEDETSSLVNEHSGFNNQLGRSQCNERNNTKSLMNCDWGTRLLHWEEPLSTSDLRTTTRGKTGMIPVIRQVPRHRHFPGFPTLGRTSTPPQPQGSESPTLMIRSGSNSTVANALTQSVANYNFERGRNRSSNPTESTSHTHHGRRRDQEGARAMEVYR